MSRYIRCVAHLLRNAGLGMRWDFQISHLLSADRTDVKCWVSRSSAMSCVAHTPNLVHMTVSYGLSFFLVQARMVVSNL